MRSGTAVATLAAEPESSFENESKLERTRWTATVIADARAKGRKERRQHLLSANNRAASIYSYYNIPEPDWLSTVQRRIRDSIIPDGVQDINEGEWLAVEVADAASSFVSQTAAITGDEPYIYALGSGDLVAEYELALGCTLTAIVGAKDVTLFAACPGKDPIAKQIENWDRKNRPLADLLARLPGPSSKL